METHPTAVSATLEVYRVVYWSYKIDASDRCVKQLTLFREGTPYWTYHAKQGSTADTIVSATMSAIFDLASGLAESQGLQQHEIGWFLSMMSEIMYELTGYVGNVGNVGNVGSKQ